MVFDAGGTQWQLKLMLKGNRSTGNVSIYLCHVPTDRTANRKVYASFSFAISNAKVPSIVAVESTSHEFTHVEDDFGFTGFIDKADLRKRLPGYTRPLLVEDRLRISVYLRVYHYQDGLADDSDSDYEDISD
ncbi:ubiquitin-specific protease ubp15, partial [Linderina pennispora]